MKRVKYETLRSVRRMSRACLVSLFQQKSGEHQTSQQGAVQGEVKGAVELLAPHVGVRGSWTSWWIRNALGADEYTEDIFVSRTSWVTNDWRLLVAVSNAWLAIPLFLGALHLMLELWFDPGCLAVCFHVVHKRVSNKEYNIYVASVKWSNN